MKRPRRALKLTTMGLILFGVGAAAPILYDALVLGPTIKQRSAELDQLHALEVPQGPRPTIETLLVAVNAERAKAGVTPLIIDERLNQSAQVKADDMVTRGYYEHIDPDGKQGYSYIRDIAPGLCKNSGESLMNSAPAYRHIPAEQVVAAWVGSPTHHQAMIDPKYNLTGFGISGSMTVQHFCQAS